MYYYRAIDIYDVGYVAQMGIKRHMQSISLFAIAILMPCIFIKVKINRAYRITFVYIIVERVNNGYCPTPMSGGRLT